MTQKVRANDKEKVCRMGESGVILQHTSITITIMCKKKQIDSENSCNYNKKNVRTMQEELELQLHEQYAINNNSNLSSVATLVAAFVLVFGGFGYLFIHSTVNFADDFSHLYCHDTKMYSLDAFLFSAIATIIVMNIMKYICLYQGFNQRFEQFITFAIRRKIYNQIPTLIVPRIYPSYYTPFKKIREFENNCCEEPLAQGLFGELYLILSYLDYVILSSVLLKLSFNFIYSNRIPHSRGIFELYILMIIIIITYSSLCNKRKKLRKKYMKLYFEYRYLKIEEDEKN